LQIIFLKHLEKKHLPNDGGILMTNTIIDIYNLETDLTQDTGHRPEVSVSPRSAWCNSVGPVKVTHT
jgi:hypothetical protein